MGVIMKNGIRYTSISDSLPKSAYAGSDLIIQDENGDISSVWYVNKEGEWVEFAKQASNNGVISPKILTSPQTLINEISSKVYTPIQLIFSKMEVSV